MENVFAFTTVRSDGTNRQEKKNRLTYCFFYDFHEKCHISRGTDELLKEISLIFKDNLLHFRGRKTTYRCCFSAMQPYDSR